MIDTFRWLKEADARHEQAMVSRKFGKLTLLAMTRGGISPLWLARCDCGQVREVSIQRVIVGTATSCGCTPDFMPPQPQSEWGTWRAMLDRCYQPSNPSYPHYGGRGIKICERWQTFDNFLADMGVRPGPKMSIDRIDVDGDYEPGNCRWATATIQANNQQRHKRRRMARAKAI
ncbi:hypothetical protein SAMN02745166_01066 [Prosthecobacter debontii]|uniref:Uncharacterized protein n=1 Tax=Prosthecobacter debontii TaxID=48467 RepID=A0A1T4X5C5_9BACT|nr:hypothetical protein SAMN02745166_01066 [Prosthecobacter debontii]